jgi:HAD superfamily hydrolase (TIGR01509 family)
MCLPTQKRGKYRAIAICYDRGMIKAFLFDWGGVMSDGGRSGELDARLSAALHIEPQAARQLLHGVWHDYSTGKIDESVLWQRLEKSYGKSIAPAQRTIWNTWEQTKLLPEMAALVARLKKMGKAVGLVSNTIPNTADSIRSHGGYAIFDFATLSYEVGRAKPDPAIYALAMQHLPTGISTQEIAFIDDQERCLEPARKLGMHTVLSEHTTQVIRDVEVLAVGE